jgi:hypothetical protein
MNEGQRQEVKDRIYQHPNLSTNVGCRKAYYYMAMVAAIVARCQLMGSCDFFAMASDTVMFGISVFNVGLFYSSSVVVALLYLTTCLTNIQCVYAPDG